MALVVGNSAKAGVRFVSYDYFKQMLADPQVSDFTRCSLPTVLKRTRG